MAAGDQDGNEKMDAQNRLRIQGSFPNPMHADKRERTEDEFTTGEERENGV